MEPNANIDEIIFSCRRVDYMLTYDRGQPAVGYQ